MHNLHMLIKIWFLRKPIQTKKVIKFFKKKWRKKQIYCNTVWILQLKIHGDNPWSEFDSLRGTSSFMCPEVPLDVLLQLLGATYLIDNVLVARLEMSLEALFISEVFKTTWFWTNRLHWVQFNYNEKSIHKSLQKKIGKFPMGRNVSKF